MSTQSAYEELVQGSSQHCTTNNRAQNYAGYYDQHTKDNLIGQKLIIIHRRTSGSLKIPYLQPSGQMERRAFSSLTTRLKMCWIWGFGSLLGKLAFCHLLDSVRITEDKGTVGNQGMGFCHHRKLENR